jgi:lysophospholipase
VSLYRRSARPTGAAVWAELGILHGYGDHSGRFLHFMRWMAERGVACHALDLRGHGRAGGRRGYAAGSDRLPNVAGCIFTNPYFRSCMHVPPVKIFLGRLINPIVPWLPIPSGLRDEWMSADEAMVQDARDDALIVRNATPRWYLGAHAVQEEVLRRAPEFRHPLLILASDADPVADHRCAHAYFEAAGSEDKTFHLYPGLLHEILREAGRERIFEQALGWMKARVPGPQVR